MTVPDLTSQAKRLLHAIRTVDAVAGAVGGIPDDAMDALTDCWAILCEQLIALPVSEPADVAAKFDLVADFLRYSDEYTLEPLLLDRAVADLIQMRDAQSRQYFNSPHPAYSHRA